MRIESVKRGSKKNIMRLVIMLLTLCYFLVNSCSVLADAASLQRKQIRVGFFALDGYHNMTLDGARSGYGYDFLRLAARYIDADYTYVGYDKSWDELADMLDKGEIDLLTFARKTPENEARFDFSKPIGTNNMLLSIRSDNTSVIAQDYDTYNNLRIGMVANGMLNEPFAQFAADRHFRYEPVYYASREAMLTALQDGEIDAAVSSALRRTLNERILEKIPTSDYYAVVRKGNTELLQRINYAIMQMNRSEGDWKDRLSDKYSTQVENRNLSFSRVEQELISRYKTEGEELVVACDIDNKPYAYQENGEIKGIIPDYFKRLAEYAGIKYKLVAPADKEESWKWRQEGTVDAFLDGGNLSEKNLEQRSCVATAPYMHVKLALLTRREFSGRPKTVAIAENVGLFGVEDEYARGAEFIKYPTTRECMQAVLDGNADAAFVYQYAAQEFANNDERGLLTYTLLEDGALDYHIVFTKRVDNKLAGIFTKAIYSVPMGTIEDLASRYTSYKAQEVSLFAFTRIYPGLSTFILLLIFLLIAALCLLIIKLRNMLTDERERTKKMQELAEKAQEANKSKTAFLFNMSHDIRTPMNAIIGFTRLAQNVTENAALVKDYLGKINISSKHLLALINEVLEMSRIESGKTVLRPELCSLRSITEELSTMMQGQAKKQELSFVVVLDELVNDNVYADKVRLEQIFVNVVSNAVKYTPAGGRVVVHLQQRPSERAGYGCYALSVKDNGIGMSEEFQKKLFTPFERENNSTVSGIQGTGLGLSITKKFVEMMDGTIEVHSVKDEGSEFIITVYLEIAQEQYQKEQKEQTEPAQADFSGKRLLLVEDNLLNREIAKTILQAAGFTIDEAENGAVALKKVQTSTPGYYAAVLMDIQMPVMNGYEATRAIRALANEGLASLPIIAVSANAFEEDKKASMEAGMNAHVGKPICVSELLKVLNEVLLK